MFRRNETLYGAYMQNEIFPDKPEYRRLFEQMDAAYQAKTDGEEIHALRSLLAGVDELLKSRNENF